MANEAGLSCSLMTRFGAECDSAFRQCCQHGRLPPTTTMSTSNVALAGAPSRQSPVTSQVNSVPERTAPVVITTTTAPSTRSQGNSFDLHGGSRIPHHPTKCNFSTTVCVFIPKFPNSYARNVATVLKFQHRDAFIISCAFQTLA